MSQLINDEFRHVCDNLRLWSFFEGVPTSLGLFSSLIVEKESAILGKVPYLTLSTYPTS
jgi:hypothetical protein